MDVQGHVEPARPIVKIVFRADASRQIGTGHVMRCLTLADALRRRGATCQFICRAQEGDLISIIRDRGYDVSALPPVSSGGCAVSEVSASGLSHASWLGCDWKQDSMQTLAVLQSIKADMLVIDHYAIDMHWEAVLQPHVRRMMVIDDLADRKHMCDFLLDQNWFSDKMSGRYKNLTSAQCVTMLGPRYALLTPEYAMLRNHMSPRDGEVRRLLVFMGGSDPSNQTQKVIDALSRPQFAHLLVDVVIGINHPDRHGISQTAVARPGTRVHSGLSSLAGWMARADLMISAGGSTSWERMCLGLPAIVVSIADNQMLTNTAMQVAGYIDFLGESAQVNVEMIVDALERCVHDPERLMQMSRKCQDLVSGTGAEQVCDLVLN